MEHAHSLFFLREVLIIFAISGVVIPLLHRYKISPALGYLLCGIIIGPYGLAQFIDSYPWLSPFVITNDQWVKVLAEVGIMLLLFMIGLELSISRLLDLKKIVLGLGSLQILITSIVIALIAYAFDNSLEVSILLGASIALSSTATVMELLKEHHLLNRNVGIISFSILLMQDLAVIPIIILLTQFAGHAEGSLGLILLSALLKTIITILTIFVAGKVIIRPILSYVDTKHGTEWFMPLILLIIIGAAAITQTAGLSLALGAFLAGLLISETEYRHEVELIVDPLRIIFMGIFFLSVGMIIDVKSILNEPVWILFSVIGIFAVKGTIIFSLCKFFRMPTSLGIYSGILLGQGGEFALLIVGLSLKYSMMPPDNAQFFFIVIALSMLITPIMAHIGQRISSYIEQRESLPEEHAYEGLHNHVVILGFGRVGMKVAEILEKMNIAYIAVDKNASIVTTLRNQGYLVNFGDARRKSLLKKIDITSASAIVITIDDFASTDSILKSARSMAPFIPITVRAKDKAHIRALFDNGATHVIPEILETSIQVTRDVLKSLNIEQEEIHDTLKRIREKEESSI